MNTIDKYLEPSQVWTEADKRTEEKDKVESIQTEEQPNLQQQFAAQFIPVSEWHREGFRQDPASQPYRAGTLHNNQWESILEHQFATFGTTSEDPNPATGAFSKQRKHKQYRRILDNSDSDS